MKVVRIDKATTDEFVRLKHYSRRSSIFWAGFGLVENGMIVGVAVYGQPSPPIQKHAFKDRDFRLFELARVVVQTKTRNAASFLVANSLKLLEPQPCAVISYADSEHGHCGIIYQATNWLYTGATKSHDKAYIVDGKRTHPMTLRDRGITDPTRWAKENGIRMVAPMEKHRYFMMLGDKRQKRDMLKKLNYPVIDSYPKCDQQRYDDGPLISMRTDDTMRTIYATPCDDETKQPTGPSTDSGFVTIGEVIEAMGAEWLTCSGRAVVYPGVMFSDYEVAL